MDPKNVDIDITRPSLLKIGNHVFIHKYCVITTHDWASWCFVESHSDFVPSHAKVTIGNNVWMGMRVMILKGVSIGDNVIIAAGSVVTKSIPSGCIVAGIPARVVSSYEDYYNKRCQKYPMECKEYADSLIDSGCEITPDCFYDDYPLFVDKTNYNEFNFPYMKVFNSVQFEHWKMKHKRKFEDFNEFKNWIQTTNE